MFFYTPQLSLIQLQSIINKKKHNNSVHSPKVLRLFEHGQEFETGRRNRITEKVIDEV